MLQRHLWSNKDLPMEFNKLALSKREFRLERYIYIGMYIIFKVYLLHFVDTHRIKIAHKGLLQTWGLKLVKSIGPELSSCCLLQLQLELRITWTFLPWTYTALCQDKVGLRGQLLPCFVCGWHEVHTQMLRPEYGDMTWLLKAAN